MDYTVGGVGVDSINTLIEHEAKGTRWWYSKGLVILYVLNERGSC